MELFEIQCPQGCTCLVEGTDGLERVLKFWHPEFISIRRVQLDAVQLIERAAEICGRREELACKRIG